MNTVTENSLNAKQFKFLTCVEEKGMMSQRELAAATGLSLGSINLAEVIGYKTIPMSVTLDPSLENVSGITTVDVTVTIEQGANVTRLVETGVGSTVMGTVTLNKPNASTPSTPATADASEIVLFSFVAMVSLAGVVMVKKASAR